MASIGDLAPAMREMRQGLTGIAGLQMQQEQLSENARHTREMERFAGEQLGIRKEEERRADVRFKREEEQYQKSQEPLDVDDLLAGMPSISPKTRAAMKAVAKTAGLLETSGDKDIVRRGNTTKFIELTQEYPGIAVGFDLIQTQEIDAQINALEELKNKEMEKTPGSSLLGQNDKFNELQNQQNLLRKQKNQLQKGIYSYRAMLGKDTKISDIEAFLMEDPENGLNNYVDYKLKEEASRQRGLTETEIRSLPDDHPLKINYLASKLAEKGTWSEPYMLGGVRVQKNSVTGEIRTAVSREPEGPGTPMANFKTEKLKELWGKFSDDAKLKVLGALPADKELTEKNILDVYGNIFTDAETKKALQPIVEEIVKKASQEKGPGGKAKTNILPKGAKQIGTLNGKPVYETPDGKRYVEE